MTDATNASRTLLLDLDRLAWDAELLRPVRRPRGGASRRARLERRGGHDPWRGPRCPAGVPIAALIGDSHAALVGHGAPGAGLGQGDVRHGHLGDGAARRRRSATRGCRRRSRGRRSDGDGRCHRGRPRARGQHHLDRRRHRLGRQHHRPRGPRGGAGGARRVRARRRWRVSRARVHRSRRPALGRGRARPAVRADAAARAPPTWRARRSTPSPTRCGTCWRCSHPPWARRSRRVRGRGAMQSELLAQHDRRRHRPAGAAQPRGQPRRAGRRVSRRASPSGPGRRWTRSAAWRARSTGSSRGPSRTAATEGYAGWRHGAPTRRRAGWPPEWRASTSCGS